MLDPQAQGLLDLMVAKGIPPVHTQTPTEAREFYRIRRAVTQPEPPAVEHVQDHSIATEVGSLTVREYQPLGRTPGAVLPALVYLHGGGWTIGDLDTHDVLCRTLCNGAHCVVVSVDYRLAPEAPFPAAYDDTLAAFAWVASSAEVLGVDASRIAVGGDSAGGNLAAAACLGLRDSTVHPMFQLLIYPATDMRAVAPSHTTNGQGYLLTQDSIGWFRNHYVQAAHYSDWRVSPLLAAAHQGLPPALVLTAGYDPLRDEGLQYADALSAAGVPTQYVCFERQIHGFITMGRVIAEAHTATDLCASALKRAFAR
jgi:acetyl esterase